MSWSAFQREMMAAMDLRPYRLATTPAAAGESAGNSADADARAPTDARHAPRAQAPGAQAPRTQGPREPSTAAMPAAASPAAPRVDPLIAALLRAAGREIDTPTLLDWAGDLRGDARAKRALWPRLRALRRGAS